jgi:hypothetical protein
VVPGTAKRAAGTDAGVMGRDASVWSGSWSLLSVAVVVRIERYKNDFIRGWVAEWESEWGCNCKYNRGC